MIGRTAQDAALVPTHWAETPLDVVARVLISTVDKHSVEREEPVRLCNYTDVYYNDVIDSSFGFMEATASADQVAKFTVRAGDVAITKDSETAADIGRAAYIGNDLPGTVYGYHLAIYRPHDRRYGKFLKWLFDSAYMRATLEVRTPGITRVGMGLETLKHTRVILPPADEAARIADFLDHETAEIDAFIADQEQLIRLLDERRASEIERLTSAPEDYESGRVPLRRVVASVDQGVSPQADAQPAAPGELGVLRAGCVNRGIFRIDDNKKLPDDFAYPRHLLVREGDLIINRASGSRDLIGSAAIATGVDREVILSDKLFRLNLAPSASRNYLAWALQSRSSRDQMQLSISGAEGLANNLPISRLLALRLHIPPIEQQIALAAALDREVARLIAAVSDAQVAIRLSKERRAALISAGVTGMIDVTA